MSERSASMPFVLEQAKWLKSAAVSLVSYLGNLREVPVAAIPIYKLHIVFSLIYHT